MTEAITGSITKAISDNKTLNKLHADSSGSQTSENKGLADIIQKFWAGVSGPMKYGIIASVLCFCVLIIGLTVFMLSPAGQNVSRNVGRAGAQRLSGRPF